ncbi:exodeoxyribonuclease 7 large subunit [Marivirga lumbricoides]|uniref:Exodeoxyribonuclease 7 large subunit n=1 Tax=Marivirga lumbricoides TaxID=1046115 RepID=A0ABQ1MY83_9BACT|nr:exodeoxyribonuclease 7 large subunit [Marivirga lumbricoides]
MQHISLADLNLLIKDTLQVQLEPSYWIVAEIGELRLNQNGHCYLEFIEKEENSNRLLAKIKGTIWSYSYRNISAWFQSITGEQLRAGLTVLANVQVQFHEVYGLSLNVKDIDPNFTLGERARKRQEIIAELQADGVFEMNKALKLPLVPQKIAVISAESAAGYGDFMNQIAHNDFGYHIDTRIFTATMQGEKAAESIIDALLRIHQIAVQFDAVIIIRGGGAQVDLDCFDDYELASHVAQFPLPVFTGIGHERDETICDLVAHTALKTPTAVAEFLIRGMRVYEEKVKLTTQNILAFVNDSLEKNKYHLKEQQHRLRYCMNKHFNKAENHLNRIWQKWEHGLKSQLRNEVNRLEMLEKTLQLINPENIFKKGYSYTSINGKNINQVVVKAGDELKTISAKQIVTSKVSQVKSKN